MAIRQQFKGPLDRLLDLRFATDNQSLIAATKSDIYIIKPGCQGMTVCPATGWACSRTIPREPTLCIALLETDVMVGSISGKILVVKGTNIF